MKSKKIAVALSLTLVLACAAVALSAMAGTHDPLVEVLIRKGILTEREAAEIEKEAAELELRRRREVVEEAKKRAVPKPLRGLRFRMLSYLDYSVGEHGAADKGQTSYNRFAIKRGYFRVDKKITPWLKAHLTYDVHQDDDQDWKVRLKYLYAEFRPGDMAFFTDMKAEVGMGHMPWLDYEEHVNPYRCQGTMAIERAHVFNSADLGISLRGNLGGRLDDAGSLVGNHHYDGRWGSWHVGVYNGGGYHASENNGNKVVEGRITIRPLPDLVPGLQFSYFGLMGEGNMKNSVNGEYPDYSVNLGMLSYESPLFILTAQYFVTEGNASGKWTDSSGDALSTEGWSAFANFRIPMPMFPAWDRRLALFGRYDHFDGDRDDDIAGDSIYDMWTGGMALEFIRGNYILLDYEHTLFGDDCAGKGKAPVADMNLGDDHKFQMVYQLKF
jgi:hypothetical protein